MGEYVRVSRLHASHHHHKYKRQILGIFLTQVYILIILGDHTLEHAAGAADGSVFMENIFFFERIKGVVLCTRINSKNSGKKQLCIISGASR